MTINSDLMKAILAMDSYSRGYGVRLAVGSDDIGTQLGNAVIFKNSSTLGQGVDQAVGFYGIAYIYNGETVIAYRGTDELFGTDRVNGNIGNDIWNGYTTGGGSVEGQQAALAFQFYNAVAQGVGGTGIDPRMADISLTGHSLGGGYGGTGGR